MHVFYRRTNSAGQLEAISFDMDIHEIIEALIESGAVPEGMELKHWRAGLMGVTLECERKSDNGS
jgi:hypothetical protein